MNAWLFATLVLIVLICVVGRLVDRQLDRGHEIRWHDRFYAPQLPVRRGRIIDVQTRSVPLPGDRGTHGGMGVGNGYQSTRRVTSPTV